MTREDTQQMARFWNDIAAEFDTIYTGRKSAMGRALDRWLRKDMRQRFDWVMQRAGDVRGKTICDVGCGSGRFVTEFARRGAAHVTGVDIASEMLTLSKKLVEEGGVAARCDFVLSDVFDWKTDRQFDITIAIGFWDYIMAPPGRLRVIRQMTRQQFLSAWPRFWTWRMPLRKVRLQYVRGCPVYFFRKSQVCRMMQEAGFSVVTCETVGKLFCVESRPV